MSTSVEVLADGEEAARRGAELIAERAGAAIAENGTFALAASGGRDPWRMYELLASYDLDWDRISIFQVDERVAPDGDPDRNLTHLEASLPPEALGSIRPMPVEAEDLVAAADAYAALLPDELDLVHLGLGPDGHTASLIPGDPVLEVTGRPVAVTGPYQERRRITLTYPTLNAARLVLWLVTGEEKREPLAQLLAGEHSIPAGRIEAQAAVVICDRAASG